MTHEQIKAECEALGLAVRRVPSAAGWGYIATGQGVQVEWNLSIEGSLLRKPWLVVNGRQTWARTLKELRYLVETR